MLCLGAVVFMMGSVRSAFKQTHVRTVLMRQELPPVPSVVQLSLLLLRSPPDLWVRIAARAVM